MRKRLSIIALAVGLSLTVSASLPTRVAYAVCGCNCMMVCDNRCQFECWECGLSEQIAKSQECCAGAHQATGDTGPCGEVEAH